MNIDIVLEAPPAVPSKEEVVHTLRKHNVSMQDWGTKSHRSLDDLVHYMTHDRLHFRNGSSTSAVIDVHAVIAVILYRSRNGYLELYEDRQVFPDGSVLERKGFNGIAETLKRSESLRDGVRRCLAEEISFRDPLAYRLSECMAVELRDPVPSEKWPGITAVYHRYIFECKIPQKLYRPDGYVEKDGNRTIFFKWKPRRQTLLKIET
jgi:hypothetical protein